jgi:hypothetical protein
MLETMQHTTALRVADATLFCADVGPGSFTGVRVGVILAKTLAYCFGAKVAGATAFDLISAGETVYLPSKKGEFFLREPGCEPVRTSDLGNRPGIGFGLADRPDAYPTASGFAPLLSDLEPQAPEEFLPQYLIEPSISIPNRPFPEAR